MDRLTKAIRECMDEKGITGPKDRIKIIGREIIGKSDWAIVTVDIFRPRKRKPTLFWKLAINITNNTIHWYKSAFGQ